MENVDSPKFLSRAGYDACIDFVGGILGGMTSVFIGQPLDTVKVKLQTFPSSYNSATHCFLKTLKDEGIVHGLYAGTIPSLAAQISENAILFGAYGLCQKLVAATLHKKDVKELSAAQNASAGSLAAFWSSLALCPTELIKCKLQTLEQNKTTNYSEGLNHGPWSLTKEILKKEGIPGLYRGFVPTLWREMPGYFFFFGGYECARYMLTPPGKSKEDLSAFGTMFCGGIGGISLWIAIFPADVIKSRAQVYETNQGFFTTFATICRNEGVATLYKGLGPTLLRTFPATAGLFLAYETTKSVLIIQVITSNRNEMNPADRRSLE